MTETQAWLKFGYVVAAERAGRGDGHAWMEIETVPVPLLEVDAASAPLAIRMTRSKPPTAVDYRTFAGNFYRPMFDPVFAGTMTPEKLTEFCARSLENRRWPDYPVGADDGRLNAPTGESQARPRGWTAVGDDRERKLGDLLRRAAEMIVVGGVVHVRCPAPGWGIGADSGNDLTLARYTAAMPDVDDPRGFHVLVPASADAGKVAKEAIAAYSHPFMSLRAPDGDGAFEIVDPSADLEQVTASNARILAVRLDEAVGQMTRDDFRRGEKKGAGPSDLALTFEVERLLKRAADSTDPHDRDAAYGRALNLAGKWVAEHGFDHENAGRTQTSPQCRLAGLFRAPSAVEAAVARLRDADTLTTLAP
jgi:hypothetical protein